MPNNQTKSFSPLETATLWLASLNEAIRISDSTSFAACIAEDGWFRDLLVFTPDLTSRCGREAITTYLKDRLAHARLSEIKLDNSKDGEVFKSSYVPGIPVVEAALDFETPWAIGKGYVRILHSAISGEVPKALALLLSISDWKGFEEERNMTALRAGPERLSISQSGASQDCPDVLIVGAAQCGLQVAARLRRMGVSTLVIEKSPRVGDIWRRRYPKLKLNTKRWWHTFLYEPYPAGWPLYTPKDMLADWMELYAERQDLVIWTDTCLNEMAIYDETIHRWTATVKKNGKSVTLHPKHIVMATGFFGESNIPILSGSDDFRGRIIHSSEFPGGESFSGKQVLVVGLGLSSADISEDLVRNEAKAVTVVQRSPVYIVSAEKYGELNNEDYCKDLSLYYNDLRSSSLPLSAIRERDALMRPLVAEAHKEFHYRLEVAGLQVSKGYEDNDAPGLLTLSILRRGGYIIEHGWAKFVIDGKIKVKSSSEIDYLTENSVVFEDGSSIEVDDIILATGFKNNKDILTRLFGEEVMSKTEGVWGYDENGESRFGYKLSGQPGLWFAVGDFSFPRFYSKHLALLIKGIEIGYVPLAKDKSSSANLYIRDIAPAEDLKPPNI